MRRPQNTTRIGGTQLGRHIIGARPASTGSKAKGSIAAFQRTTATVSPTSPLPGGPAPSFSSSSSSSQQSTAALGMDGEERKKQKHPAKRVAPASHRSLCSIPYRSRMPGLVAVAQSSVPAPVPCPTADTAAGSCREPAVGFLGWSQ